MNVECLAQELAAHLVLTRPLVCVDLEATGIWPGHDRIVQIATASIFPDGRVSTWSSLVNPERSIPSAVTAIHGITDAAVASAPTFAQLAPTVAARLSDCDLTGYNVARFDRRLLVAELGRVGVADPTVGARVIDAYALFVRQETRSLDDALRFYGVQPGQGTRQAHDARSDVEATVAVLVAQLHTYPNLPRTIDGLHQWLNPTNPNRIDADGKLIWRDGVATVAFGAQAGTSLADLAAKDRGFLEWVLRKCLGAQLAISVNHCPPPRDPRSRMTSFKRTQRKYVQKAYRVRNWREYETGLRARGSLTVWLGLTDGKLANWNSPRPTRRTPGRQRKYSNHAIETTVTLGLVFGLASRQTEGFLRSRLTLLKLDNDVPDHSTISRRKARLGKVASSERRTVKPVHLRIDSSGLSVHVGQWRTPPKARDYRKLHLAVDEPTSDVVAGELTSKRARDASRVASLVGQIERPIASAKADAAYDTGDV